MDEVGRGHIIKNFFSEDILEIFREYSHMNSLKDNSYNEFSRTWITKFEKNVGHLIDVRAKDMLAESLLLFARKKISSFINKDIVPVASFYRIYGPDCKLDWHTDLTEYEWSATICMGYDAPECWPIYLEKKPIYLEAGDALIYEGSKYEHGRFPFKGSWQIQLFLHYREVIK